MQQAARQALGPARRLALGRCRLWKRRLANVTMLSILLLVPAVGGLTLGALLYPTRYCVRVAFPPKRDSPQKDRQRLLRLGLRRDYCDAAREINPAACSTETASVLTTRS
jgi:hypothetical protein